MRPRRLRPLHADQAALLPPTCPACPLGAGAAPGAGADGAAAGWLLAAEQEWGQAGVGCWEGDRIVGYLLLSTPLHVPRSGPQSGAALSPEAAVVMTIRVLDEFARLGLGRQLVQAAAGVVARGPGAFRALESEATRGTPSCALQSVAFFERVGFTVCRENATRARVRLDLDRAVRWRPHLAHAVDRLSAWVRPLPPEPANRGGLQRTA